MHKKLLYYFFIALFINSIKSNIDYNSIKIGLSNKIDMWIKADDLSWFTALLLNADQERWNIYNKKDFFINEIMNHVYESRPLTSYDAMDLARKRLNILLGSYSIQRTDEFIQNKNVPVSKLQAVKSITHKEVQDQFNSTMIKCQANPIGCMNEFLDNLPNIATREAKKYAIDYSIIKVELVRAIDAMITVNISTSKYAIVEKIIELVKTCHPENQDQARVKAWELLYPALEQLLADYCELTARKMIAQNYKNPRNNPEGVVLDIKEKEIKTSISKAVSECRDYHSLGNKGCLNELIIQLPSIVDRELRNYLGSPDCEKYQYPKPSAPPMENQKHNEAGKKDDDIHEIYPNGRSLDDVRINLGSNKDYREASCCVCGEDYQGKARARVNLNCSAGVHAMCSTCFFALVHINNKTTCPVCRSEIIKNDYPAKDISVYVNLKELKEQCPTQLDKIKQYFPYHNLQ